MMGFNLDTVDILSWIILCGAVLCIVGCLAASLSSAHWHPLSRCDNQKKHLRILPDVPLVQHHHHYLITFALKGFELFSHMLHSF